MNGTTNQGAEMSVMEQIESEYAEECEAMMAEASESEIAIAIATAKENGLEGLLEADGTISAEAFSFIMASF